jgi:hypothetical protein
MPVANSHTVAIHSRAFTDVDHYHESAEDGMRCLLKFRFEPHCSQVFFSLGVLYRVEHPMPTANVLLLPNVTLKLGRQPYSA